MAIPTEQGWLAFEQEILAASARHTLAWIQKTRPLMDRQWKIRYPNRPLSIGGLETGFQEVVRRLGDRRFVFRNQARLELVFDLMALDLAKEASELRYRELIRAHLLGNRGRPMRRRRALDDDAGSSLRQAVIDVETRLQRRRQQNVRAQRAWLARLAQNGRKRARTPSRRPRRKRSVP